jgi:hypothetical protein
MKEHSNSETAVPQYLCFLIHSQTQAFHRHFGRKLIAE